MGKMKAKWTNMQKTLLVVSLVFSLLFLFYLVGGFFIDVQNIGVNDTKVPFATINEKYLVDYNETFYSLSEWMGYPCFLFILSFGLLGLIQWIQRKNMLKVDYYILALGVLYLITLALYGIFLVVNVNYRPILDGGELENSFPSSHTLMAIITCGSGCYIFTKKNTFGKLTKLVNVFVALYGILVIVFRWLSGAHWPLDIYASFALGTALTSLYILVVERFGNISAAKKSL